MITILKKYKVLFLGLLFSYWICTIDRAYSQQPVTTMMGRQSSNAGIRGLPAAGPVTIDGDLKDWDLSGQIWSFADINIRDTYSAETAVMWDKQYVYIAFKFRDPTPVVNTNNPDVDAQSAWKGDAVQLRLLTDWPLWITFWKYSKGNRSAMLHSFWKDKDNVNGGQDNKVMAAEPGSNNLGEGVEMALKINEDKKGYVQELRIPWKLLYKKVPEVIAGLNFRMGLEFYWGGAGESTWPVHRYADNLQPGATNREFFWTAKDVWGDVKLLPKGKVEPLKYVLSGQKIEGSIPLKMTIPAKAKEFTVVVEAKDGKRLRNLGAQLNADLYSVGVKDDLRNVEVLWDGRDDKGKLVAAGEYKVRGLSHQGLGADYLMSFFNPGTPPWQSGSGGSWGADHGAPKYVASAGGWTILGWGFAEGGSGIIGIGPDGLKKWGERRGVQALTADQENVYFISRSWGASGNLCRLNKTKGTYKPFIADGKSRPFELSLNDVFGKDAKDFGKVTSMASNGDKLALAMSGGIVALLDAKSANVLKNISVTDVDAIAFDPKGACYVVRNQQLAELNLETGAIRLIKTPGLVLQKPATDTGFGQTLAVDPAGNIGIFDNGKDQQVKFFSAQGVFKYAAGRMGGRPIRGDFDQQAMSHVSALAVDNIGQIWTTECWEYPRRVSVWGANGQLVRDYIGNTGYSGTGAFLHDQDPSLAYYGPVEMKLDLKNHSWKVNRILWVPGEGELFAVPTDLHAHPHRFTSNAGGKVREYMFLPPYRNSDPYVVYMEGDDKTWKPVSAIGAVGQLSGDLNVLDGKVLRQPSGEYRGLNAYDAYFWNDLNSDGKVQFTELTIVPNPKPVDIGKKGALPIPYMSGWGGRMAPEDLSFITNGVARYVPLRFRADGAPIYGPASIKKYAIEGGGDFVPVLKEKLVLALFNRGFLAKDGMSGLDAETGRELWSYPNPYPSVHGSHIAPMPHPGLIIGSLKILGVAALPGNNNGSVFGIRGNLGQDFYMTTDGLFIGTVFQDGRLPSLSLPQKESELFGQPMESYGGGSEPFTGWMGGYKDGKVRLISGIAGQTAMILEMNGLDRIKRFNAANILVTDQLLSTAAKSNEVRDAKLMKDVEKRQVIAKLNNVPGTDGRNKGWEKIPSFNIQSPASGFTAKVQLGYDANRLYLAMDVVDPSPWKNEGIDFLRLFKTGDAVDIQLAGDPKALANRIQPVKGDLRIVFSNLNGAPAAVLMQPVNPLAKNTQKVYTSPVGDKRFDEVRVLKSVLVGVIKKEGGYRLEASIPLNELGITPVPGTSFGGDIGFISSDVDGKYNTARTYWANPATNLVSDEPMEAWLFPSTWGTFSWGL